MSAPDDELVEAVARAINSADNEWAGAPRTAPHEPWPHAVARAVLSVPALRDALTEAAANEGEMLQLIDQRDEAQEWADRLAACAGGPEVIGEHSNTNSPWANALDLLKANDR